MITDAAGVSLRFCKNVSNFPSLVAEALLLRRQKLIENCGAPLIIGWTTTSACGHWCAKLCDSLAILTPKRQSLKNGLRLVPSQWDLDNRLVAALCCTQDSALSQKKTSRRSRGVFGDYSLSYILPSMSTIPIFASILDMDLSKMKQNQE